MLIRLAIVAVPLITSFLWAQFILRFFLDKEYRMGGDYVIAAYGGFVFTIATFILPLGLWAIGCGIIHWIATGDFGLPTDYLPFL
jgi:hypothetical protein